MAIPEDAIMEELVNRGIGTSGLASRAVQQAGQVDLTQAVNQSQAIQENAALARKASFGNQLLSAYHLPAAGGNGGGVNVGAALNAKKPTAFLNFGNDSGTGSGQIDKGVFGLTYDQGGGTNATANTTQKLGLEELRDWIKNNPGVQVVMPGAPQGIDPDVEAQLQNLGIIRSSVGVASALAKEDARPVANMNFLEKNVGEQFELPNPSVEALSNLYTKQLAAKAIAGGRGAGRVNIGKAIPTI